MIGEIGIIGIIGEIGRIRMIGEIGKIGKPDESEKSELSEFPRSWIMVFSKASALWFTKASTLQTNLHRNSDLNADPASDSRK